MKGNRRIANLSALILVMAMSAPVMASSPSAQTASKDKRVAAAEKRSKAVWVDGEVTAVDPAAKTVTLKAKSSKGKETTVAAMTDDHTRIQEGKANKSLSDLKVGDHVRLQYEHKAQGDLARQILVQTASK